MSRRILIVEEEEPVRTMFACALREQGIDVDERSDGDGVAETIRSGAYNVVVLGLRLPGTDGFAILSATRDIEPHPIVLVLSASAEDVRRVAGDRSVMMCVNKAFAMRNLEPVIAAIAAVTR